MVIAGENVALNESAFDPYVDASMYSSKDQIPTASSSYSIESADEQKIGGSAGIGDKTAFGLRSHLSTRTGRTSNNTPTSDLDPAYRSALALELTQPLLKDFGTSVNTTDIKVAENQQRQAS